ncbi:MAG TPA: hypothetical protein PK493_21240, partial [Pseudomonadota bacterium]|nr:hypothetical protein [Pseudomonadota bacterium]
MRAQLLDLARRMARAIRAALDSRAALGDDIAPRLRELLPPLRLWGLSVVLAPVGPVEDRHVAEVGELLQHL